MLYYTLPALSGKSQKYLQKQTQTVIRQSARQAQYETAESLFKNKKNKAFEEIKKILSNTVNGDACFYCERDRSRDIDHIRPKRHYPQECFAWENYVYACTICNQGHKKERYAVFDASGNIIEFDRDWPFDMALPSGSPVPIDIRREDPAQFLQLDLQTGRYVETGSKHEQQRGKYTIGLFDLNNDNLLRLRRGVIRAYYNGLKQYVTLHSSGKKQDAERELRELIGLGHPSILQQLQNQAGHIPILQQAFDLFLHGPQPAPANLTPPAPHPIDA